MTKKEMLEILIAMVTARKARADSFTMNNSMYVESNLCQAEIEALQGMLSANLD